MEKVNVGGIWQDEDCDKETGFSVEVLYPEK